MSDFYQLTNSTSDFKSRSNDVFDRLINLEKQHDIHTKTHVPIVISEEETPSTSQQNPSIPNHAITFKKRSADHDDDDDDDDSFTRPSNKWKKYDLDDVSEHHMGSMSNRHALHDFLRTRTKPENIKETTEDDEHLPTQIFKRPLPKKPILISNDDDDEFISIRAPIVSNTVRNNDDDNNDDEVMGFKLQSNRAKTRGVLSTNEKKVIKQSMEISEEKDDAEDENEDDDDIDELFEP